MKLNREQMALYAVTDRAWLRGESLTAQVERALRGGASFVQLREKGLDYDSFLAEAREIKALCAAYRVPFVINDNVEIAFAADADGVHVGQSDTECAKARERLGPDKLIGVSCRTVEQALAAQFAGADYLGVGAVFPTGTKTDAAPVSYDTLRAICAAADIPTVAIGGIGSGNVENLRGSGIAGVAVVSAIFAQPDVERAARELKEKVSQIL